MRPLLFLLFVYTFMNNKIIAGISALMVVVSGAMFPADASGERMHTSWYGPYYHGRTTANGETFDMYELTAAHKTLPFGTELRVCYQGCVDVRINDRGPYIGARELDLSFEAARRIGLIEPGVAHTKVSHLN